MVTWLDEREVRWSFPGAPGTTTVRVARRRHRRGWGERAGLTGLAAGTALLAAIGIAWASDGSGASRRAHAAWLPRVRRVHASRRAAPQPAPVLRTAPIEAPPSLTRARRHTAPVRSSPASATLHALARCESSDRPGAVSPGGQYRGEFQFDEPTWRSVGGTGDPANAPVGEQWSRAMRLLQSRGTEPWPVCGAVVGGG